MTFVCPYCKSNTKANGALHASMSGIGKAKCTHCGRKFLFRPAAMEMERIEEWKRMAREDVVDTIVSIPVALLLVVLSVSALLGVVFVVSWLKGF